jgi:hypothetical protein
MFYCRGMACEDAIKRNESVYTVIALGHLIHDSFEPLEGSLLSGDPVEVSPSWTIVFEAAYLRAVDAFHLLFNQLSTVISYP